MFLEHEIDKHEREVKQLKNKSK